jgi:hypothetical protein
MVPVLVIVPPVRPVPAVIEVRVPAKLGGIAARRAISCGLSSSTGRYPERIGLAHTLRQRNPPVSRCV